MRSFPGEALKEGLAAFPGLAHSRMSGCHAPLGPRPPLQIDLQVAVLKTRVSMNTRAVPKERKELAPCFWP